MTLLQLPTAPPGARLAGGVLEGARAAPASVTAQDLARSPSRAAASAPAGMAAFVLPAELEARQPPEARGLARDEVRLLVTAGDGSSVAHARFMDLPDFLIPGDVLVANDSATLPAALDAYRPDGSKIALHLSVGLPGGLWVVEPRHVHPQTGETLALPAAGTAILLASYGGSQRLWVARLEVPGALLDYLSRWGRPITYAYVEGRWPIEAYQTVYARKPGSAEMPSAGRAFSESVLQRLRERGVEFLTLTLHTGVSSLESHEPPYEEPYRVPGETAEAVNAARVAGRRVIAVGTTAVRALESATDERGRVVAAKGWTDLVITPERGVQVVDGLITGFHEPGASHLAMLEAIAGHGHVQRAYRAALEGKYLWHEFGDMHLLLP